MRERSVGDAVTFNNLIPVTWGGVMYLWNSWRTLFPLIVGFAGIVGFGLHERRLSRKAYDDVGDLLPGDKTEPIIRFSIFTNATLIITYSETVVHGIVLWSLLCFLPLYYEAVQGYTPIFSGVAILPETGLVAPISVIAAFLCTITGRYRWALWGGWMFKTLGSGLLFLLGPHTSVLDGSSPIFPSQSVLGCYSPRWASAFKQHADPKIQVMPPPSSLSSEHSGNPLVSP